MTTAAAPFRVERTEPGRPGWRPSPANPRRPSITCVYAGCRTTFGLGQDHDIQAADGLVQPGIHCTGCGRSEVYQLLGWSAHLLALDAPLTGGRDIPEVDPEPADYADVGR